MVEYGELATRILGVLIASSLGLTIGSLIHYATLEHSIMARPEVSSAVKAHIYFAASALVFLSAVGFLYLNVTSPLLISFAGMAGAKLLWNVADSNLYVSRLRDLVDSLKDGPDAIRLYLSVARNYRQIQDLRSIALKRHAPQSTTIKALEELIEEILQARR